MKTIKKYIIESKHKDVEVTLKKFLEWYSGEKIKNVTSEFIEDPLGWDYLADDLGKSLDKIAKIFNDNLGNTFKFDQEDIGNCKAITWKIGNDTFEVDSVSWYGEKLDKYM